MSEALVIQIIQSVAIIIAALAPSTVGLLWLRKRKLAEELECAYADILFLLEVEARAGKLIAEYEGSSRKRMIRADVRYETNLDWSGKFTPSKIKSKSKLLSEKLKEAQ